MLNAKDRIRLLMVTVLVMGALVGCDSSTLDGISGDGGELTGTFTVYEVSDGLVNGTIEDMAMDYGRHGVWLATQNGVAFWSRADSTFTGYGAGTDLPSLKIYTVAVTSLGDVWVGTDRGAAVFGGTWNAVATLGTHPGRLVNDIRVLGDLSVWFGTRSGVAALANGVWQSYTTELGASTDVTSIVPVGGDLWFGTQNGITVYDRSSGVWEFIGTDVLPYPLVTAIFNDGAGTVWVGTATTAASYTEGMWHTHGSASGLDTFGVNGFACDNSGVIWLASDGGVFRYVGETWHEVQLPDVLGGAPAISILADALSGSVWIGTTVGAARYDPPADGY